MLDEITHVIRGQDHISNTPKQLLILRRWARSRRSTPTSLDVLGDDGKKLSKRHGAQSVDDFRRQGYIPEALVNFARLGGRTTTRRRSSRARSCSSCSTWRR